MADNSIQNLLFFLRMFPSVVSNYRAVPPTNIDIELSNRCNLSCDFCWFHGEHGIGDKYKNSELTTDEVLALINQLSQFKPSIYVGGSEPFIRKDFLSILGHIKKHKLNVAFTTNGTLMNGSVNKELVSLAVDSVTFSLDGDEKLHDKIRGKGVFQKVINNIQQLDEIKKRNNSAKPVVIVNITLNPLIIGNVEKTIHAIRKATHDSIDYYRLHHLWFITRSELHKHQKKTIKYLGCKAAGAASHRFSASGNIDLSVLSHELLRLNHSPQIKFFPHLDSRDLQRFYAESIPIRHSCIASFRGAIIKPDGDMVFCPDEWIDDYILGNIRHENFLDIWNNKKARHFRATMLRHGVYPSCKRCSWMYSFS